MPKHKLRDLYIGRGLTLKECSEYFDCSPSTIWRNLYRYAIPSRNQIESHKNISNKTRGKLSKAGKGRICSLETRRKISEALKGLKRSKETKRKLSEINRGENHPLYGRPRSEEIKRKISGANKGKHLSPKTEFKKRHILSRGENNPMYGRTGENAPGWKNGLSREPYPLDWREILKEAIRQRDNYQCQLCGIPQNGRRLSIHHIDYDKTNLNPKNLVGLHVGCHSKTNYNRKKWTKYFTAKVGGFYENC